MRKQLILKIVITALLSAILLVQEEILSFIPNVQLTVFLLIVYGGYVGIKWGSLIVIIHTLLDCIIGASFTPVVIIPMMVGWECVLLIGYLIRKKSSLVKAFGGAIGSIIYAFCFAIANSLFLEIDIVAYLIADIPFDAILIAVSFLTILWLYNPIMKVLKKHDVYNMFYENEEDSI